MIHGEDMCQEDAQTGSQVSIRVHDLGKTYKMYAKPADRLKEVLLRRPKHQAFESLKSISFQVLKGESLGIIGDNGAGKSTLLKILAGTLTPSSGLMEISGRVAALLELGAGFHQEFTGRQNIYLNASLLGLSEAEIKAKENDILDFAELGQFIDRPIKTYSSGMVVRLAFSIATSVDPDILIIDEALSVGDQYFQKKSLDRMLEFRKCGKTIVFCSHSMYTVNILCNRAIWLENSNIREQGVATEVTAEYENYLRKKEEQSTDSNFYNQSVEIKQSSKFIEYILLNGSSESIDLAHKENLNVEIGLENQDQEPFTVAVAIERNDGLVCHGVNLSMNVGCQFYRKGKMTIQVDYPNIPFFHGQFSFVGFILDEYGLYCFHKKRSAVLNIVPAKSFMHELGLLELPFTWTLVE